ncbi:hypothetical protein [Pseudomonas sp. NPDC090592]|uniref:hypothetical protein n=1 Tax=Pseudomonas sp. NPDC090592 TaxID=3364480 RepID=UPI00383A01B9
MLHHSLFRAILLITAVTAVPACTAWWQPRPEFAQLKIYTPSADYSLMIRDIDGAPLDQQSPYLLSPGPHTIQARAKSSASSVHPFNCEMTLSWAQFESGKIYAVTAGTWNGKPSLMLQSARGEVLDNVDCSASG